MSYFTEHTLAEIHNHLISGEKSVADLVVESKRVLAEKDADINSFLGFYTDVDEQIEIAQAAIDAGEGTLLTGIPIAVKDNLLRQGQTATAASKILAGYTAPYTATAIAKMAKHKPVFLGRTNMDEFAMGGSTENSAYGVTKNPHNLNRVAGGSSGGSAAIVAMGAVPIALGSDTGGSVRQPAAYCGVYGLKPTYGAVSRHGLMAMGSSLDQVGVMANNATDTEAVFNIIKGSDPMDATTLKDDFYGSSKNDEKKINSQVIKKVGIIKEVMEKLDEPTRKNIDEAIQKLTAGGAEIVEVSLPHILSALACYYIIMPAEASTNLSRYDGVKFGHRSNDHDDLLSMYVKTRSQGFGAEVKRRIILGTYVLSSGYYDAYYQKATDVRQVIADEFRAVFKEVDVLLTPTAPGPAFRIGAKTDPLQMYLTDIFTVPANIAGVPGLSVPFGTATDDADLPLGIQFMAAKGDETALFAASEVLMA